MIKVYCVSALSSALEQFKIIIKNNKNSDRRIVVFCEDRLSLAAERAVCSAVGGAFNVSVYTFSRFLAGRVKDRGEVLSGQGSAMVMRKLIEANRQKLKCFKKLSSPQAAQTVYDTIALLYSSRVSAEQLAETQTDNALLKRKTDDLALLYAEYFDYLKQNGLEDRNSYLKRLPEVITSSPDIKGADVIFLGFQSFTRSTAECVTACMGTAKNVCGIFTGGAEDIYVNEALGGFMHCAEAFGGAESITVPSELCPEAELLRRSLFNGEAFRLSPPLKTGKVHIFEAADGEEELEYIAASIKKHVSAGVRYRSISLMLPSVEDCRPAVNRVFTKFNIPYYVDAGERLSSHFICGFISSYLACAADGCLPESVNAVISNPLFCTSRKNKDLFRNYVLRLCNFRGGAKRPPKMELCEKLGFDYTAINEVYKLFTDGLKKLPSRDFGEKMGESVKELLRAFGAEERLSALSEEFEESLPAQAAMCSRAFECAVSVIDEAARLTAGESVTAAEFNKLLKSGFAAVKISIIPPKQDAVFVGDVANTANTGSTVVFAARLTDEVPSSGSDSALLTDRDLTSLESLNMFVSPKISLVNMRARETTALNICAFTDSLYLSYPARLDGSESRPSEIIAYAREIFATPKGNKIAPLTQRALDRSGRALPYYCSAPIPALGSLVKLNSGTAASSVYALLCEGGYKAEADAALSDGKKKGEITSAYNLFTTYGSVSPTALENYFSCPYLGFMRSGLRISEREEGNMRPVDSGNFIHTVLQNSAPFANDAQSEEQMKEFARKQATALLNEAPYSSLCDEKSGEYAAAKLVDEAEETCLGMYRQLRDSRFKVQSAESVCEVPLGNKLKLYGRIDRVDCNGDMVRVIDYKTGSIDCSPEKYYMGLKLQLQLYLRSAAKGRRAVAAYYFPASVEYREKQDGDFRLKGFMDGGEDVVTASDVTLEPKKKSKYFDAYLNGRATDSAMASEVFADFLDYGVQVARKGAGEMTEGYIAPSPAESVCDYCKMGGCCGYSRANGERAAVKVKCADIAQIAKNERGN